MASLAGGSTASLLRNHRPQEPIISQEHQEAKSPPGPFGLSSSLGSYSITYRPGDKNVKADSLSRIHAPEEPSTPEPTLPLAILISPIQWALEEQIRVATFSKLAPPGGPDGKTYVPTSLWSTLLGSIHASPGSGHPGSQRTLSLLQARYWWPCMARCLPVCPRMLRLRHLQISTSPTCRKVGSPTDSLSSMVSRRGQFRHQSP